MSKRKTTETAADVMEFIADIDTSVLEELIVQSFNVMKKRYV